MKNSLNIERRGCSLGWESGKRQLEELGGHQNLSSEAVPMSSKEVEKKERGRCQARSNCHRGDKNIGVSESLRGRRSKEMTQMITSSP